jgi:hypothetical protein
MPTRSCCAARAKLAPCAILALLAVGACDKVGEGKMVTVQSPVKIDAQALDDQMQGAKSKLLEQQRTFAERSRQQLARLDEKIEALKTRATAGTERAKQRANQALADLTRERDEARAALERAQSASEQHWDALKDGAAQALGRAERAYNDALEKLKSD